MSNYDIVIPANFVVTERNCSQYFLLNKETGFCFPVCGEWKEFSDSQVVAFAAITSLLYFLHVVGTVIALAFSCYNRKIM